MDEPGAGDPGEVATNAPGVVEAVENLTRRLPPCVAAGIAGLRDAVQRPVGPSTADLAARIPAAVVGRGPRIEQRIVRAVRPAPACRRARRLCERERSSGATQREEEHETSHDDENACARKRRQFALSDTV